MLQLTKRDFLNYLLYVSPYMLPFVKDRLLTLKRYPDGIEGESFYQKNCPSYAPEFVTTYSHDQTRYIVCNDLQTLLWLGNQAATEFHVPFETIKSLGYPTEIVFDLDPPSINDFNLAMQAALALKEVLDKFGLSSFAKTSGGKGLQVYIPLPDASYSYEATRHFTKFIAEYLVAKFPQYFTIERLKKNRDNKLYIDYVQHAAGKTIIAPYSVRGDQALVAAPLFWHEVTSNLQPAQFSVLSIYARLAKLGSALHQVYDRATQVVALKELFKELKKSF